MYKRNLTFLMAVMLILLLSGLCPLVFGQAVVPQCAPGAPKGLSMEVSASETYFVWRDCPYEWIEIFETGTNFEFEDDDVSDDIMPADFVFPFYGAQVAGIDVCSNGFINFDPTSDNTDYYGDIQVPSASNGDGGPMAMPAFIDLDSNDNDFTNVFYKITGDAPNRVIVVQWNRMGFNDYYGMAHFQAQLYETSGDMKFIYKVLSHRGQDVAEDDYDTTLGIQKDATEGIDLGSGINVLEENWAVLFTSVDTDGDELPDVYEDAMSFDKDVAGDHDVLDADSDDICNADEAEDGTSPILADTDNDGLDDGVEEDLGSSPFHVDTDCDGLVDGYEVNTSLTSPVNPDHDGDLLLDGVEVLNGLDPKVDNVEGDWNGLFTDLRGNSIATFDYYVDARTGNDANGGQAPADAFATINAALDAIEDFIPEKQQFEDAGPGNQNSSIYIAPGVYPEFLDLDNDNNDNFEGTILFGASPLLVILDGEGTEDYAMEIDYIDNVQICNLTCRDYCEYQIYTYYTYGLRIDNCRFFGGNSSADFSDGDDSENSAEGIYLDENTDGENPVRITNCCFNGLEYGVDIEDGTYYVLGCSFRSIIYSSVYVYDIEEEGDRADVKDCDFWACGGDEEGTIYFYDNGDDDRMPLEIMNNRFMYCGDYGLYFYDDNYHVRVENNLFYGCNLNGIYYEDDDADEYYSVVIKNNTFALCGEDGIYFSYPWYDYIVTLTYNNFTHNGGYGVYNDSDCDIFADYNNFYENADGPYDDNDYYVDGSWENDTAVDPKYTDLLNGDLTLQADSTLDSEIGTSVPEFVEVSLTSSSPLEADSGSAVQNLEVSLSRPFVLDVTLSVYLDGGTATADDDFAVSEYTQVTIPAGETSATVPVTIYGDEIEENDETANFYLANIPCNLHAGTTEAVITVTNDDFATISIDDVTVAEGADGQTAADFTVSLFCESSFTVTVDYDSANDTATAGADYTAVTGTLTFTPGQTSKTVSVDVDGDTIDEIDETYTVDLTNATNTTIDDDEGLGTITDDDTATLSIDDVGVTEGDSGAVVAGFTVTLTTTSSRTVTVDYTTLDGAATGGVDYTTINGTLTFNPGTTTQPLNVSVAGDVNIENNENYFILLSNPVNSTITDTLGLGSIADDDTPGVTITESGGSTDVIEGGGTDTYTVVLDAPPVRDVVIEIGPDAHTAVTPAELTFTDDNWDDAQTVTVSAVDDALVEGDHTSTITHDTDTTDNNYDNLNVDSVTVNVTDNDLLADAGDDVEELPGSHILDGSGSSGLAYAWTQTGGTAVTIDDDDAATTSFTALATGAYSFRITASAGDLEVTDDVTITVTDPAPIAVTNLEFTMELGDDAELTGSDSYDPNDTAITAYAWDLSGADNPDGPIGTLLDNAALAEPTFTPAEAGVYLFSLQVTSSGQDSELAIVQVIVIDEGNVVPPSANAGIGQTVALNTQVTLTGHESVDPDSDTALTYDWEQISGPVVVLSNETVVQPTFTPAVAGRYVFALMVTDTLDDNLTSPFSLTAVAAFNGDVNTPPSADADLTGFQDLNGDDVINAEETFTLDGSDSSDAENDTLTYEWEQTDGPAMNPIQPDDTSQQVTYTPLAAGTYTFTLTVNDGTIDSDADEIEVQVLPDNAEAPVAVALANNSSPLLIDMPVPAAIALSGADSTGNDGDTSAGLTFHWNQFLGPLAIIDDYETATASFTPSVSRTYGFLLTVTNASGCTATDEVYIAVSTYDAALNPTGNSVPVLIIKVTKNPEPGHVVTINLARSYDNPDDPDGVEDELDGLIFYIRQIAGPPVILDYTNPYAPTFIPTVVGIYVFEIYVDDGNDMSPPQQVEFDVAEQAPAAVGGGGGSSGCFIATAAYGSYAEKHVVLLREFRDRCLLTNTPGSWFVNTYYKYSPPVAGYIAERPALRGITRISLLPLIGLAMFTLNTSLTIKLLISCFILLIACTIIRRRQKKQLIKVLAT
ncbi:Calx-beta domain-containing protein [Planctomycetota bacterium]